MSNDTNIQEILNYTGSSLLTLNCILSGLANQLKETQGAGAVEAAQAYAVELAKTHPSGAVAPDVTAINSFFSHHK
ncbi:MULTISPECIES: hypothetical protein [unclassified Pseudomonas]|uniref:hypothetical protein n=1 Tax=unclassified Pseudomonas TaxID=196821 RepID=UPI0011AEF378|nr:MULTISPECIES: hypothetical protein [unclassified Pseudomonas]